MFLFKGRSTLREDVFSRLDAQAATWGIVPRSRLCKPGLDQRLRGEADVYPFSLMLSVLSVYNAYPLGNPLPLTTTEGYQNKKSTQIKQTMLIHSYTSSVQSPSTQIHHQWHEVLPNISSLLHNLPPLPRPSRTRPFPLPFPFTLRPFPLPQPLRSRRCNLHRHTRHQPILQNPHILRHPLFQPISRPHQRIPDTASRLPPVASSCRIVRCPAADALAIELHCAGFFDGPVAGEVDAFDPLVPRT